MQSALCTKQNFRLPAYRGIPRRTSSCTTRAGRAQPLTIVRVGGVRLGHPDAAHCSCKEPNLRDEPVGLLIDRALVGAGAVKINCGLTMQIRRSCTTVAHFFSCSPASRTSAVTPGSLSSGSWSGSATDWNLPPLKTSSIERRNTDLWVSLPRRPKWIFSASPNARRERNPSDRFSSFL